MHVQGREPVHLGGAAGFSISRQRLLDILTERATGLGVQVRFQRALEDPSERR